MRAHTYYYGLGALCFTLKWAITVNSIAQSNVSNIVKKKEGSNVYHQTMATLTLPNIFFSSLSPSIHKPPTLNPKTSHSVLRPHWIIDLLKSCSNIREFSPIHAHLITANLIHDPEITSQVLAFLLSVNNLDCAHQILSYSHEPESIIWNTLLESKLKEGCPQEVLECYYHMVTQGVLLDISTFHFLIHACCKNFDVKLGSEVHGRILKCGFGRNKSLNNNLMGLYSKCGKLKEVCQLFEKMTHRDVISWNTMISCYVLKGMYREALDLFDEMLVSGVLPDEITMVSLVSTCAKLKDLEMGKRLHLYIVDNKLWIRGSLLNCLVDMYSKCGKMDEAHGLLSRCDESEVDVVLWTTLVSGYVKSNKIDKARQLFDKMNERSLVSWTTMMSGYVQGGYYCESLELFQQMRFENVIPDEVALVTVLSACVHLEDFDLGRSVHAFIVTYGMLVDGFLGNALLDLYAKCGKLDEALRTFEQLPCKSAASWNSMLDGFCRSGGVDKARDFFNKIPEKDIVSWNTMVNSYVKHDLVNESFEIFCKMQSSNVKPDKTTLISLLSSCAKVGALNHGIWVNVYIEKNEIGIDAMLGTALIDMYGKCGCVEMAYEIFTQIIEKNVFVWTAMMAAYAMEGQALEAIDLYLEMEERGVKPDHVTFIALLAACSHGGLVDEGYKYFNKLRRFYNITPTIHHYGCMVDLLGRVGHLEETVKFIERMPIEQDVSIWSSLMRACRSHHNVELAEQAFKQLIEIDPTNNGAHVLLSNIYADAGRWDDASKVRTKLHETGAPKQPGFTMIEQNGVVHEFVASNLVSADILCMLQDIERRLLVKQELSDTTSQHSERLAVAFGLINNQENSPIRVVNSVRMCRDCHSVMKLISQAYDREIVIRDNYRFHRFTDGHCSCKDYW
jgi:pentatricopeptide repeat protein